MRQLLCEMNTPRGAPEWRKAWVYFKKERGTFEVDLAIYAGKPGHFDTIGTYDCATWDLAQRYVAAHFGTTTAALEYDPDQGLTSELPSPVPEWRDGDLVLNMERYNQELIRRVRSQYPGVTPDPVS